MELTAKQKKAAEELAADERYRAALKFIGKYAELCGRQQADITAGLKRLEQVLEQKSVPDFERGWPIPNPKGHKK